LLFFFPFGLFKVQLNNRYGSIVSSRNKAGEKKGKRGMRKKKMQVVEKQDLKMKE
jgi:hypothetical protein